MTETIAINTIPEQIEISAPDETIVVTSTTQEVIEIGIAGPQGAGAFEPLHLEGLGASWNPRYGVSGPGVRVALWLNELTDDEIYDLVETTTSSRPFETVLPSKYLAFQGSQGVHTVNNQEPPDVTSFTLAMLFYSDDDVAASQGLFGRGTNISLGGFCVGLAANGTDVSVNYGVSGEVLVGMDQSYLGAWHCLVVKASATETTVRVDGEGYTVAGANEFTLDNPENIAIGTRYNFYDERFNGGVARIYYFPDTILSDGDTEDLELFLMEERTRFFYDLRGTAQTLNDALETSLSAYISDSVVTLNASIVAGDAATLAAANAYTDSQTGGGGIDSLLDLADVRLLLDVSDGSLSYVDGDPMSAGIPDLSVSGYDFGADGNEPVFFENVQGDMPGAYFTDNKYLYNGAMAAAFVQPYTVIFVARRLTYNGTYCNVLHTTGEFNMFGFADDTQSLRMYAGANALGDAGHLMFARPVTVMMVVNGAASEIYLGKTRVTRTVDAGAQDGSGVANTFLSQLTGDGMMLHELGIVGHALPSSEIIDVDDLYRSKWRTV